MYPKVKPKVRLKFSKLLYFMAQVTMLFLPKYSQSGTIVPSNVPWP